MNIQAQLTKTESEIIGPIVYGAPNKEIAVERKISVRTVETMKKNIYAKLEINCIAKLCVYWFHIKHNTPIVLDKMKEPFIIVFFLSLSIANEFNSDSHDMRAKGRTRTAKAAKARKGRKNQEDNTVKIC